MKLSARHEALVRQSALRWGLTDPDVDALLRKARWVSMPAGATVDEGLAEGSKAFLVMEGKISVDRQAQGSGQGGILLVGRKTAGGEDAGSVCCIPPSMMVESVTPVVGLLIEADRLEALFRGRTRPKQNPQGRPALGTLPVLPAAGLVPRSGSDSEGRIERDSLGERSVPAGSYIGIQTLRAVENFPTTGLAINRYPALIRALAMVKQAAVRANRRLGLLDQERGRCIDQACQEIMDGQWHDQFVVDAIQSGAGTSSNMNANEVIANRALELMGRSPGQYEYCHPLDAVNLGQEMEAYAVGLQQEVEKLDEAAGRLLVVNLGGTAVGTGINADPRYAAQVIASLREISGLDVRQAPNLVAATQDSESLLGYSSALKSLACKLSKVCDDLRLLSAGPRTGFGEVSLPEVQPGSTIMPGKVNPVIPEVVNQIAFRVIGNDLTVTLAAQAAQLEPNAMLPVAAHSLLESLQILSRGVDILRRRCVEGIKANEAVCKSMVERSIGQVTALSPFLGYDYCSEVAMEALRTGRRIRDILTERGVLEAEELDTLLDPQRMTGMRSGGN